MIDWTARNAIRSTETQMIPFVSSSEGTRTELVISNRGDVPMRGSLSVAGTLQPSRRRAVNRGSGGPGGLHLVPGTAATATIDLAPGQSLAVADVLAELRASAGRESYLVFTPETGSASIVARNRSGNGTRTATSILPIVSLTSSIRKAQGKEFGAIESASAANVAKKQSATFTSGLGLLETSGKEVVVRATLQFSQSMGLVSMRGAVSKDYALAAGQFKRIDDVARDILGSARDQFDDMRNMQLDLVVVGGDGAVMPMVVATENGSGDVMLRVD
jgi:hypothetical protein